MTPTIKNVAVISFFRNSARTGQLVNYFRQASALRDKLAHLNVNLRLISVEGDSSDSTRTALSSYSEAYSLRMELIPRDHGKREFGSTEEHERLETLSWVGNGGLEAVKPEDDVVLYVESDLLWDPGTIVRLIDRIGNGVWAVSPLVFAGEHFYDVFCFRALDGSRFSPFYPYSLGLDEQTFMEVSSTGSCIVMDAEVARNIRIPGAEVLIGFWRVARERGYNIFVDAAERIHHPA